MNTPSNWPSERGAVLAVAMIFLLVVTIIAVVAARNSTFGVKMSSNLQDAYSSFQSAEGALLTAQLLSQTTNNPFNRDHELEPFAAFTDADHPLRDLNTEPDDMKLEIYFTGGALPCPRKRLASSVDLIECEFYRVEAEDEVMQRARTKVDLGLAIEVPK